MLFNSFTFLIFLTVVVLLFYVAPHKIRWILLLVSSFVFYACWNPLLTVLLVFSIFINYTCSIMIFAIKKEKFRKRYLIISIIYNFGLLFVFKYLMFFNRSAAFIFERLNIQYPVSDFSIILPMGISFYTFQAAGYTFDIYRKRYHPERNFFKFSLFITFFPQLVAGPIERASNLMPQLFSKKKFSIDNFIIGMKYLCFGFFKKIVIADRIAVAVNTVYNSPEQYSGLSFLAATFLFAYQIYCDFSGYSDIAVGCSKLLGIDLMQNFTQPYLSGSIREFWRRWHISLSGWFKDYLYIPLGGSRVSRPRFYFNTFLTFLSSGLWHGANWTFVLWGVIHGVYQIVGDITSVAFNILFKKKRHNNLFFMRFFKTAFTFILVCFAWIFFRANNISDAFYIASNMFSDVSNWTNQQYLFDVFSNLGMPLFEIIISFCLILILMLTDVFANKEDIHAAVSKLPGFAGFCFYFFITVLIISLGVFYNAGEFIYFQF